MTTGTRQVVTEETDGALWIRLDRPTRHNALVPELIDDLEAALDHAAGRGPAALVLTGNGASFSTGGDIAGFLAHAGSPNALLGYAEKLVGGLHAAILKLLSFPAPVLAAVNGPVTGGATGLVLAADMVAMAEQSFLQPYYSAVGFAPDGGWTALMPERIGTAKTLQIQYLNERICAEEALALGLATHVCPRSQLDNVVAQWLGMLGAGFHSTHRVTRKNVWDAERLATVRARLDQEKSRFLELVIQPETLDGMKAFLQQRA
ncbi:MAG: enoyl-CoA hydratase/isomerase family protein [Roseibium sp.]|uniref:enoyl-CoA hydratase/isomerase family protein n=1 Tax=Roseibium sp. TaxID=1936156 RepID=UPI003D9C52A6